MNKSELITFLRDPNKLSPEQLEELEEVVNEHPYFLSARLLLAKASKEQGHPKTKKRVASAAIYSTDRILLKKYLNGNLFFLQEPAKIEEEPPEVGVRADVTPPVEKVDKKIPIVSKEQEVKHTESKVAEVKKDKISEDEKSASSGVKSTKPSLPVSKQEKEKSADLERTDKRPSALKSKEQKPLPEVPELPSGELDSILDELERDMENLKASREKFAEVQQKIEEDDAVSEALKKASTTEVKDKVESEGASATSQAADEKIEDSKKSAAEITMQILDAAKRAKEEVAREEAQEEAKEQSLIEKEEPSKSVTEESAQDTPTPVTSSTENVDELKSPSIEESKSVESLEEEIKVKEDVESKAKDEESKAADDVESEADEKEKSTPQKPAEEDADSSRAERVIREPRFSRFATRSYLKPPEDIDPSGFLDEGDKEEKEVKPQTEETSSKAKEEKKEPDSSSKIKLPDLSKAKAVPRKRKKSTKTEALDEPKEAEKVVSASKEETEDNIADKASDTKKTSTRSKSKSTSKDSSKEVAEKEDSSKTEKKKATEKKETKTEEKKPAVKKTAAKKATEKKAAEKKTPAKKAAEKKPTAKKTTVKKKTTTKKATAKKETPKKETAKKSTRSKSKTDKSSDDKKEDGKSDPKSQSDLIDKFIKDSPTIKYQRKDETSTEDLAEQSSSWDPNLASEYLAEIYLHQGNKKRAIEIYEALSLKYPEKKSYFADLISKLK